jgi:hypothetical protein
MERRWWLLGKTGWWVVSDHSKLFSWLSYNGHLETLILEQNKYQNCCYSQFCSSLLLVFLLFSLLWMCSSISHRHKDDTVNQISALILKNAVFWDVAPCSSCVNRHFGGTITSIFRVEKSASKEPAWTGGCRLSCQSKTTGNMRTGSEGEWAT